MTETINLAPAIELLPVDPALAWASLRALALAAALVAALAVVFLWRRNA